MILYSKQRDGESGDNILDAGKEGKEYSNKSPRGKAMQTVKSKRKQKDFKEKI